MARFCEINRWQIYECARSKLRTKSWAVQWLSIVTLVATTLVSSASEPAQSESLRNFEFHRGINIYPYMWPWVGPKSNFQWPPYGQNNFQMSKQDFALLRAVGFDFVRLPIDPGPLLQFPSRQAELIDEIKIGIDKILASGLNVIVDLHPQQPPYPGTYTDIVAVPKNQDIFLRLVEGVSDLLATYPNDRVALELMNEPTNSCDDAKWPRLRTQLFQRARSRAGDIFLVVTGSCYSELSGMKYIDVGDFDNKTLYTFHYYAPYYFTHQGATWAQSPLVHYLSDIPWPAERGGAIASLAATSRRISADTQLSAATRIGLSAEAADLIAKYFAQANGPAQIKSDFDQVDLWAAKNRIPRGHVLLGEFGVLKQEGKYKGADLTSATDWLKAVRQQAEAHHFAWCMWTYGQAMALISNQNTHELYPEIVQSLGLDAKPLVGSTSAQKGN